MTFMGNPLCESFCESFAGHRMGGGWERAVTGKNCLGFAFSLCDMALRAGIVLLLENR
jgi:hypothetical protein